jgi:hypothetical protein
VNSVLVSQPVGSLDGVVHVPPPVVLVHVSKGGVNSSLGGDGVRSGGEKLGDTSSVESGLGQTESRTKTGSSGSNDDSIVLMVLSRNRVSGIGRIGG